jgi:hypothetical protein
LPIILCNSCGDNKNYNALLLFTTIGTLISRI